MTKTILLDPDTARMLAETVDMQAARLGVRDRDISESVIVWRAIHMMWQAEQTMQQAEPATKEG